MSSKTDPVDSPSESHQDTRRGIPGVWVVVGMFAFGSMATGILFVYWHFHTAPFKELQSALAAEFEGSRPRVDGGQRKQHKDTPRILRVVLKVEFPPRLEKAKSEEVADRVMELAKEHHPLENYDTVEIHLYWPEKEKTIHEYLIERKVLASH
ncbi:MAG: hypothetical protein KDA84_22040 [Planctomycetaceae bacterium]|nr:hypothetical protein [Planctomycetaceae bacterium]